MPDSTKPIEPGPLEAFDEELKTLCEKHDVVTLDQLVKDVSEAGLLVNNLFQFSEVAWRCSLRKPATGPARDAFFEYGDGPTPEDALLNALYNANTVQNYSHMAARKKIRR